MTNRCSINADGEDRQIMILAATEMQRILLTENIVVDKPSSSTTEITQSADQELFETKNNF